MRLRPVGWPTRTARPLDPPRSRGAGEKGGAGVQTRTRRHVRSVSKKAVMWFSEARFRRYPSGNLGAPSCPVYPASRSDAADHDRVAGIISVMVRRFGAGVERWGRSGHAVGSCDDLTLARRWKRFCAGWIGTRRAVESWWAEGPRQGPVSGGKTEALMVGSRDLNVNPLDRVGVATLGWDALGDISCLRN